MTALWKTTRVASDGACAARAGSWSLRSPATRRGGSAWAIAIARRSRSRRKSCSGQISASSQATSSGFRTSRGLRSIPARHTTRGSSAGSGTGPVTAQPRTG